jgi:hypothetical protein
MTVLASAHDKLLAVDIDRLPPPLRAALLNQPLFSIPVEPAGAAFEPARWAAELPVEAPQDLFGKLGIKSWRDGGSLRPIFRGMPLRPVVERLLGQPTGAQRLAARAWLDSGTPLLLHLYAYRDFSQISEVRWQVDARGVRFVSACQRGQSAGLLGAAMPRMRALAAGIAAALPPTAHIVEFACLPDGDVRLVEINPGLELPELRALTA